MRRPFGARVGDHGYGRTRLDEATADPVHDSVIPVRI